MTEISAVPAYNPILISCSDCRSKFGGERSASLRLTEGMVGTAKH